MVNGKDGVPAGSIDYAARYEGYWSDADPARPVSADATDLAEQIVMSCGPGRVLDIGSGEGQLVAALLRRGADAHGLDVAPVAVARANERMPGRFTPGSVLALPFADSAFDTVVSTDCLQHLAPADVPAALQEIRRVARRCVVLRVATTADAPWHLTVEGRAWWEARCFEAGLRKHPAYYALSPYESLNREDGHITIVLERVPDTALERFPLSWLKQERDLHMDMLRESGSRSDAHVARYHLAAAYVRPGDVVIDAACGMGYGVHVTRALTRCSAITGIDGSEAAVAYGQANFGAGGTASFREGYLPDCLHDVPDASVDVVISFETLEHVEDPVALLAEFRRVLTPGGRLVASVPHDWSDETGEDPNPFHLHVYDKARFLAQLEHDFDVERLIAQTADRVKKPGTANEWLPRDRSFAQLDPHDDAPLHAEWLLAVASKSPVGGESVPYEERAFSSEEQQAAGHALAFARDYRNPWLVRSLVSIGMRTENAALRERWARETLVRAPTGSADEGAALCVLGYLVLGRQAQPADADLIRRMEAFAQQQPAASPNALRWQVSLAHVLGLLALAHGRRDAAGDWFQRVLSLPVADYSATLLTKPAEAAFLIGQLRLADGHPDAAREVWTSAFREVAMRLGERLAVPATASPPGFELREMATVLSLLARLVGAARLAGTGDFRPVPFHGELQADEVARVPWLERQRTAWERIAGERAQMLAAQQDAIARMQQAKDWLASQREAWEHKAAESEQANAVLQAQVHELATAKDWLLTERDAWQQVAQEREAQLGAVQAQLQGLRSHWSHRLIEWLLPAGLR